MNGISTTQFVLPRQLSRAVHDGPSERYMGHVAPVVFEPLIHEREIILSNAACQSSYDFDVSKGGTGHPLPLLEKAMHFGASGFLHVTLYPSARIEIKQSAPLPDELLGDGLAFDFASTAQIKDTIPKPSA